MGMVCPFIILCSIQCPVCPVPSIQGPVCRIQSPMSKCPVCSVPCPVSSVQCPVPSVQFPTPVCKVQLPVPSVPCPSGMARMSQFFQQIQCVPFEVEPSTHLFLVQQYLRDAASLAYPAQHDFIKKQGLSSTNIRVLRSKGRVSNRCIHIAFLLRNANARALFYLWRGWKHDHSRKIFCSVRGFSPKHLCIRQLFSRAAERSIRAQLASLLELEHLAKLTAKADSALQRILLHFLVMFPRLFPQNKNLKIQLTSNLLAVGLNTSPNVDPMCKQLCMLSRKAWLNT